MNRTSTDTELDLLVTEILSTFHIEADDGDAVWRARLRDLRRILRRDYRATVRSLHRDGRLPVRELVRETRRHFPAMNRQPMQFDEPMRQHVTELGIALRMEEVPQRRSLRAFYHRDDRHGALIWLNVAHLPGAVAASFGHELGHWFRERLLGPGPEEPTRAFFNNDFAEHLRRPEELFADLFPVLSAYPTSIAERVFPTGNWPQRLRKMVGLDRATLARLRAHLGSNYGFDIEQRLDWEPPRRLYYVTSMLHFARLRWALLEEFDL
jgi:hypothetical protein